MPRHEDKMMTIETRQFSDKIEVRRTGKSNIVSGYAAVFDRLSDDLGGFREIIDADAFSELEQADVRALFNHDPNQVLGRTTAGTLRLDIDGHGLRYELDLPDTTIGRDLAESIRRGDINQSSFAFQVADDEWSMQDGYQLRTIKRIGALIDVSPVTYPAYPDATVSARNKPVSNNLVAVARMRLLDLNG